MTSKIELPPGRELDALVAEKMGMKYIPATKYREEHVEFMDRPGQYVELSSYSTDISAAMPIAIKHQLSLIPLPDGRWFCGKVNYASAMFDLEAPVPSIDCYFEDGTSIGETPAHAICLAFLSPISPY